MRERNANKEEKGATDDEAHGVPAPGLGSLIFGAKLEVEFVGIHGHPHDARGRYVSDDGVRQGANAHDRALA